MDSKASEVLLAIVAAIARFANDCDDWRFTRAMRKLACHINLQHRRHASAWRGRAQRNGWPILA